MARTGTKSAIVCLTLFVGAANATADMDIVSKARMAAVEGDHVTCAKLADEARKRPGADGRIHHLYATCQAFAADIKRSKLSKEEYVAEIQKAIDAYQLLLRTPGLLPHIEERASVEFVIEQLQKRINAP
ncbi:exported protein of unknown function [Candidatus Filomicrobium marinum]|uniref:Uncharacterized protein n=1 Tax=Candidatus Filomicrobium marinum TaxID=1608628 RepID=A0A0D6JAX1_9HYPH|nr:hypothetical protein [Candidatus Filomicrobium marinum]CFX02658.1 exported protein of unknown function [Candidatus Filomicrobium marinum]CPR15694.1 exported protein of unknown function [Candidatus Filomicrobium marinum]